MDHARSAFEVSDGTIIRFLGLEYVVRISQGSPLHDDRGEMHLELAVVP